jgi:type VI secretion system secreted protein Hcp
MDSTVVAPEWLVQKKPSAARRQKLLAKPRGCVLQMNRIGIYFAMKHTIKFSLWAGVILLLLSSSLRTFAAYSIFLQLDGTPGEATASGFEDQIVVTSFSHGVSTTVTTNPTGGPGASEPTFTDLTISKSLDKASPLLYLNCAQGKVIKTATLTLCQQDEDKTTVFYTIKLGQVLVTSVRSSGNSGGDSRPTETITLNFSTIDCKYVPQNSDGTAGTPVEFKWNLTTNKAA